MRPAAIVGLLVLMGLGCSGGEPKSESRASKRQPLAPVTQDKIQSVPGFHGEAPVVQSQPAPPRSLKHDWPSFLGPLGTSVSPEKGIIAPWPKDGLKIVWMKKIGEGYPAPSISQGKLYNFDRHKEVARLTCMKADTGEELWRFEYPTKYEDFFGYNGGPRCCPVIDEDRVYLYGAEGMLHCVSAADGKLIWKIDTIKEFNVKQNFFGVGSAPVVEKDLLLVQVGGSPADSEDVFSGKVKTDGTAIVAFDKRTGAIKYKKGDELASYAVPVLADVGGKRLCFLFARHGLLAFDPADGKEEFHFPWKAKVLESVNASNPVVAGNLVMITECYGPGGACLKVKPGGYDVVWSDAEDRNKRMHCHWMTPIHHDGYVYGCSGRHMNGAELSCVELATGKVQWAYPDAETLEKLGGRPLARSSLLMIDGHFICLDERGLVVLLKVNPKKYEEVSRMLLKHPETGENLLKYPAWAAPVVVNGLLYLRGDDHLVCLELIPEKK